MDGELKPPFSFYGSKYNAVPRYPAPTRDEVVEPFAGSASYSIRHGVRAAVLVEKDDKVAETWRYLIRTPAAEIARLPLLPNPGDSVNDHDLELGARYLIGFWLNRGSATPKLTRTAYSARTDRSQLNWGERARERVAGMVDRLRSWTLIEGDFTQAPDVDATWFIDPPYREMGKYYRCRLSDADFPRLAHFCQSRQGQVIVCEGEGHREWLPFHQLGSFKSTRGRATEYVWTNGPNDLLEAA